VAGAGYGVAYDRRGLASEVQANGATTQLAYAPDGHRYRAEIEKGSGTITVWYLAGGAFRVQQKPDGTVTYRQAIVAGGAVVGQITTRSDASSGFHYLYHDGLGSTAVLAGQAGTSAQALAYGPWGRRRQAANWSSVLTAGQASALNLPTRWGYTGGEQIDSVGVVVLGARVYVPALGRWLSPDPAGMGSPYVYVHDNLLSDVDPTGEFGLWDAVKLIAIAVAAYYTGGAVIAAGGTTVEAGAAGGFVAGYAGSGGNLKDGAIGALGGAAMGYFGGLTYDSGSATGNLLEKGVVEGIVGGTLSAAASGGAGGSFLGGFVGTFASAAAGGGIDPNSSSAEVIALRTTAMAVAGGTASELAGGSFANGAWSAAFQQLFNEGMHALSQEQARARYAETPDEQKALANGNPGAFYLMRIEQGDQNSVVVIGLALWGTSAEQSALGAKWVDLSASARALLAVGLGGYKPVEMQAIGISLARAYIKAVKVDLYGNYGDTPGLLSAKQIYDYHHAVFKTYHISMDYFGGTPVFGQMWELKIMAPVWCPNCDPSSSPGGG
jgi:RHS repeat-associated protein